MVQHGDIDHTGITGTGGSVATDAIWDTAGDLVVGTGANTAAKLAIGNAGGHVSRINGVVAWDSGTANPGSAVAGDRFWRTDIHGGLPIFYDGTRWLSQQIFSLNTVIAAAIGSASRPNLGPPFGGFDVFVERFSAAFNVTTTNNGTNYWTAQLQRNVTNTWVNVGSAVNTSAASIDDWVLVTTDIDAVVTTAEHVVFGVLFDKVLAPGNAAATATLYYRLVIT